MWRIIGRIRKTSIISLFSAKLFFSFGEKSDLSGSSIFFLWFLAFDSIFFWLGCNTWKMDDHFQCPLCAFCAFAQLVTTFIFFSTWDKSHVKCHLEFLFSNFRYRQCQCTQSGPPIAGPLTRPSLRANMHHTGIDTTVKKSQVCFAGHRCFNDRQCGQAGKCIERPTNGIFPSSYSEFYNDWWIWFISGRFMIVLLFPLKILIYNFCLQDL